MNEQERLTFAECSVATTVRSIDANQCVLERHNLIMPMAALSAELKKRLEPGQAVRLFFAMESPHTRVQWSVAYAKQGKSDLDAYVVLKQAQLPACHSLHYLQMAAEKIAKAYELVEKKSDKSLDALTTRHTSVSIEEFIKTMFKRVRSKALIKANKTEQLNELTSALGRLASQLEKCQPAVDKKISPQNVEYPWEDPSRIYVPCEQRFFIDDFESTIWLEFLDTLKTAADLLIQPPRSASSSFVPTNT